MYVVSNCSLGERSTKLDIGNPFTTISYIKSNLVVNGLLLFFLKVRTSRTVPVVVGTIQRFILLGEHEEDEIFSTGGEMEIAQASAV